MAIITSSVWDNSVKTQFGMNYDLAIGPQKIHGQFVKRRQSMGGKRGQTLEWIMYERMKPQVKRLNINTDVTPQTSADTAATITMYEYGNDLRLPVFLEATAYTDAHEAAAETIAQNFVDSSELLIRQAFISAERVYRPAGHARSALGTAVTGDDLSYTNLSNIQAIAASTMMPKMDNSTYTALIHPALVASLTSDSTWLALGEYNGGKTAAGNMFLGEVGQLNGFRFTVSPWAKVYWGGGLVAGTVTTLSAATAAGDTTCTVADATGKAAGDWIRVGTNETEDTEVVQIISVDSTTFTIQGVGASEDDLGFKFAHASGAAVDEAESVGVMMVLGAKSLGMIYSDKTGPDGKVQVTVPSTAIAERFTDFSWHLIAGWDIVAQRYAMQAEFPLPVSVPGYTEPIPGGSL